MRAALTAMTAVLLASRVALAVPPAHGDEMRVTASSEAAQEHFELALVHYRGGKYRSAIIELEKAYGLDPTGKDLVHNLAVVYEKLGELDAAIVYLERYVALEPDPDDGVGWSLPCGPWYPDRSWMTCWRTLDRSAPSLTRTWAATPSPSRIRPRTMCSVPM